MLRAADLDPLTKIPGYAPVLEVSSILDALNISPLFLDTNSNFTPGHQT